MKPTRAALMGLICMLSLALGACSSLWPAASPQPAYFALQAPAGVASPHRAGPASPSAPVLGVRVLGVHALGVHALVVHVTTAAPGFDSARIIYTRQPHRLEYFAHHEWVDAPARMLAPLMVAALEGTAAFSAVVLAPSAAVGDLQLTTQLLRLQQEFGVAAGGASRVRLTLRAQLMRTSSRQVLATRDFEQLTASATEDAPGGVAAANLATQVVLAQLAAWCQEVAATQHQR